jgi:hypothetical protein
MGEVSGSQPMTNGPRSMPPDSSLTRPGQPPPYPTRASMTWRRMYIWRCAPDEGSKFMNP